jgi:hypothetical protein
MGTYTVNRDCTGELRLSVYSESGALLRRSIWFVVYVDNARELRGIMTSLVTNGMSVPPVITVNRKKVSTASGDEQ